jgi:hypothetical protein
MESDSGYHEKMDALDLIMNALKDHEKQLDEISHRLEQAFKKVKPGKPSTIEVAEETQRIEATPRNRTPQLIFNKWSEFKDTCQEAKMIAFDLEGNRFQIYAMMDEGVFTYDETLPHTTFKVVEEPSRFTIDKDTLTHVDAIQLTLLKEREYIFKLKYDLEPDEVKVFLSRELGVLKDKIFEGKVTN